MKNKISNHPFPILVRHFFIRLFKNDYVSFEDQMKEKTISFLALVAILSAHIANSVLMKYILVSDEGLSWVEKCYFISYVMLFLGFITVFEWDVIFPDTRDFSNLLGLPIKLKMIFASKFASLCLFVGLFAIGANAISTFVFWFHLIRWQAETGIFFSLFFILIHWISLLASCLFIFFLFVFIIGFFSAIFPVKLFKTFSLVLRTGLMIICVFLMVYIVLDSLTASPIFSSLPAMKADNSLLFYLFPPMWFTGLYEYLLGSGDPQFKICAAVSLISLLIVIGGFFISAAIGYKKHNIKTSIKRKRSSLVSGPNSPLSRWFNTIFLRNPIQRAVFHFVGKTLRLSMIHKMRLAIFAALGVSLELILLVSNARHLDSLTPLNRALLTVPMILCVFLLIGVRNAVNIPLSIEANWIFRMTEDSSLNHYVSGLKKGILFYVLCPLFAVVCIGFSFFYGWEIGFLHALYGIVLGGLFMEVLFFRYHKIPFACSYLPGKAKVHLFWLLYFIAFVLYVSLVSTVEIALLQRPLYYLLFLTSSFMFILGLRLYQKTYLYSRWGLLYEDNPDPAMVTLSLERN